MNHFSVFTQLKAIKSHRGLCRESLKMATVTVKMARFGRNGFVPSTAGWVAVMAIAN